MEFGHHPEPAVDFCLEVDAIEQEAIDRKAGLPSTMALAARIDRAMQFKVGGDTKAIAAKRDLRLIEAAFKAGGNGLLDAHPHMHSLLRRLEGPRGVKEGGNDR